MKALKLLLIFSLFLLGGMVVSYLYIQNFLIFSVEKTKMDIKVIEEYLVGINVDTDALHFSKIPRGSAGIKNITLDNNDERPHLVQLKAYGNISQFVYVSENNFVMGPHTSKNMSVIAQVPLDAELGYYEGELYVIFMNIPWGMV